MAILKAVRGPPGKADRGGRIQFGPDEEKERSNLKLTL
jgi:hypothetical protein